MSVFRLSLLGIELGVFGGESQGIAALAKKNELYALGSALYIYNNFRVFPGPELSRLKGVQGVSFTAFLHRNQNTVFQQYFQIPFGSRNAIDANKGF